MDLIELLLTFEGSDALGNGDFTACDEAAAEIASLRARVAELEGHLNWYADTFCEASIYEEVCGRLNSDECSGCRARAALQPKDTNHDQ